MSTTHNTQFRIIYHFKSNWSKWLELTGIIKRAISGVCCILYGAVHEVFLKRGTGQAGQESKTHAHTHKIKTHTVALFLWHTNQILTLISVYPYCWNLTQPSQSEMWGLPWTACVCVGVWEREKERESVYLERQALLTAWVMLSSGCWERRRQILSSCLVERDEARDCA